MYGSLYFKMSTTENLLLQNLARAAQRLLSKSAFSDCSVEMRLMSAENPQTNR